MTNTQFDIKNLLDDVINAGREYAAKGQEMAENKLDIPEDGPQREVMLNGLKKGALASALLVGLLGTKGGRRLTGTAIKLGSLAALGTAAYKGFQNWRDTGDVMASINDLNESDADRRGLLLIEAMVAAANADGRVDDEEQSKIKHQILEMHLPGEMAVALENIIDSPLSAEELAQKVSNHSEASEVYLATRLLIDDSSTEIEKQYRDQLVSALGMPSELVTALEAQVA